MLQFKILIVLFSAMAFRNQPLISQELVCGFDKMMERQLSHDSLMMEGINLVRSRVNAEIHNQKPILNRSLTTIPIVVHVVWKNESDNISADRIHGQVQMLNEVFNNLHPDLNDVPGEFKPAIGNPSLNFCLADKDPSGNPTSGILRVKTNIDKIGDAYLIEDKDNLFFSEKGGSTAWDTDKYLNIWIVSPFAVTGFASSPGVGDPSRDGVVLNVNSVEVGNPDNRSGNGRVAVHEIGHYLGLSHIWGDDLYAQDSLCMNDDGFSDTPPQWTYSYRCPDELHPAPYSCGNNNMYVNFMDYSPDECLSMFTQQQVDYMLSVLGLLRPGLNNSNSDCFNFSREISDVSFAIHPNPTRGFFELTLEGVSSIFAKIEIYNLSGFLVWEYEDFLFDGLKLNLPDLVPGIYIVRIGDHFKKLVIL